MILIVDLLGYNTIMMSIGDRVKLAQTASGDDLWLCVRDSHPQIALHSTLNRNLTEEMAVYLAKKKSTPSEVLGMLAGDIRFKNSYKLKVSLCKNPKTPQKFTLSLLKFIRIFDLGDMTKDQAIPITVRQKIEYFLSEKIPSLPSGSRLALLKRSSSVIVLALMERGDKKVASACLDSPVLTESHICRVINKPSSRPHLIRMIAEHQKWSLRYSIKYALIRNFHTPLVTVKAFIETMKTADLKELYADRSLPLSTRPFIYRELFDRDESVETTTEEEYEIPDPEELS